MQNADDGTAPALAVAIVGLVVWRQLHTRPVRRNGSLIAPVVLGVLGISGLTLGIASADKHHPLTTAPVALLTASFAVAAGFGVARARTVHVWRGPQGEVLRKGTAATTGLWIASVAMHIGLALWIDHSTTTGSLGTASLYAYLAIGVGTQNLLVRGRAAAL
ncbi:hypothetical protein ACH4TX_14550 [Streptomyces sp. NPDC021098]|uniref:hypothetical protein n=1 Tax=unclassified Streptomyces TaxID=2593676 RepID=UPI0037B40580